MVEFSARAIRPLALLLISASAIWAQSNLGSITGTVRDQTGAIVSHATLAVQNAEAGSEIAAGTSETGNYSVSLPPGTYDITVSAKGFKTRALLRVPVIEGVATRRDFDLEVGQVSEEITVIDSAPLLKTQGGEISYRIETRLANQLPIFPLFAPTGQGTVRNPLHMLNVLPGVQFNNAQTTNVGVPTIVVNGLPANSQTWTVDGQDATPTILRGVNTDRAQVSIDAYESMTVQTSNFAPEFGKAGGAAINFATKSGSNSLHGSAYNYYVNEFLNAGRPDTDWSDQGAAFRYRTGEHIRDVQRRQDYGFSLGGPVVLPKMYRGHKRTFFFANFEHFYESSTVGSGIATMPTQAYRTGDFTASGCSDYDVANLVCRSRPTVTPGIDVAGNPIVNGGIYDPATYRMVNGLAVRNAYPGQRIPVTNFDQVAKNVQDLFPLPTNNNITNNFNISPYRNFKNQLLPSVKIDHNFLGWRIAGFWSHNRTSQETGANFAYKQPWSPATPSQYRNHTIRVNAESTLSPTMMLHIGAGYFHQQESQRPQAFDQRQIGLPGAGSINALPDPNSFPILAGLGSFTSGGFSPTTGAALNSTVWEQKPTANLNLTWVKNNHTYKFGGEVAVTGYPAQNRRLGSGQFTFSPQQTANLWIESQGVSNATGLSFASFLLGSPRDVQISQPTFTRLGGRALAFFAQDLWKITPRLTVEYGVRYDFQTYLREQHGRLGIASFSTLNPSVNLNGGVAYEATCGCRVSSNYPFAFGPRASASYQVNEKTVLRAGFGVTYNLVQSLAGNTVSTEAFAFSGSGTGLSPLTQGLQGGSVFYTGNPFGNTAVTWPNFDPGKFPPRVNGLLIPASPLVLYHPDSRPARITQWSAGLQREIMQNLVIEANYVGNRGAWFFSPGLDTMGANSLGGGQLARYGLDISSADDRLFLTSLIGSSAAAARGFRAPYAGFPANQTVSQAIRPVPHWNSINSYLGPNRGNSWYDALQLQATKRYSHGLDFTANFTWAHGSVLGMSGDTDYGLPGRPQISDPFNREIAKQLNQFVPPLKTVIAGTYTTPRLSRRGGWVDFVSLMVRDWQIGTVLQYQSGQLLMVPSSNNGLTQQLKMEVPGTGAVNSGQPNYNPYNYIPGAPLFRPGFDPNARFDPRAYNSSNPFASSVLAGVLQTPAAACPAAACAWANPPAGQWGVTAPYLEGFRWRRRPLEAVNFGRNFRFGSDGRFALNVRAEFQNIFNRHFYGLPSMTVGSTQAVGTSTTARGEVYPTSGFGVVNTVNGAGSSPRSGMLVGRLTF